MAPSLPCIKRGVHLHVETTEVLPYSRLLEGSCQSFFYFYFNLVFFVYLVEARLRTNAQQGGHATRGAGVGSTKQWGTETLGDLWKGEGWDGKHEE